MKLWIQVLLCVIHEQLVWDQDQILRTQDLEDIVRKSLNGYSAWWQTEMQVLLVVWSGDENMKWVKGHRLVLSELSVLVKELLQGEPSPSAGFGLQLLYMMFNIMCHIIPSSPLQPLGLICHLSFLAVPSSPLSSLTQFVCVISTYSSVIPFFSLSHFLFIVVFHSALYSHPILPLISFGLFCIFVVVNIRWRKQRLKIKLLSLSSQAISVFLSVFLSPSISGPSSLLLFVWPLTSCSLNSI